MKQTFKELEKEKLINLLAIENYCFSGAKGGGIYKDKHYPHILIDGNKNLFHGIASEVKEYFKNNRITLWGGSGTPSGNMLSSQIACLNHLFPIKSDKKIVLQIARLFSNDFVDILPVSTTENGCEVYIDFEVVISPENRLNEGKQIRGTQCTSIDAFMHAIHSDGKKYLVPIEWKYTEHYSNEDKSTKAGKGDERLSRYSELIKNSDQLKTLSFYKSSVYFFEPFYQLMRQTLWSEQVIRYQDLESDDFLHIHVIPSQNEQLLNKMYKCSNQNMEQTWRSMIVEQSKYKIVHPIEIVKVIAQFEKWNELHRYLIERY